MGSVVVATAVLALAGIPSAGAHAAHPAKAKKTVSFNPQVLSTVKGSADFWVVGQETTSTSKATTKKLLLEHQHAGHWKRYRFDTTDSPVNIGGASTSSIVLLVLHEDSQGSSEYRLERLKGKKLVAMKSPKFGANAYVAAVAGVSLKDIWAVGNQLKGNDDYAKSAHWNGHKWKVTPISNEPTRVLSIATSGANNAVARSTSSTSPIIWKFHNGKWVNTQLPPVQGTIDALVTSNASHTYGIGSKVDDDTFQQRLTAEFYDGKNWSSSSTPSSESASVNAAVAVGSTAFAVGQLSTDSGKRSALLVKYSKGKWVKRSFPKVGSQGAYLSRVAATSASHVIVLGGSYMKGGLARPFLATYNGHKWKLKTVPN